MSVVVSMVIPSLNHAAGSAFQTYVPKAGGQWCGVCKTAAVAVDQTHLTLGNLQSPAFEAGGPGYTHCVERLFDTRKSVEWALRTCWVAEN